VRVLPLVVEGNAAGAQLHETLVKRGGLDADVTREVRLLPRPRVEKGLQNRNDGLSVAPLSHVSTLSHSEGRFAPFELHVDLLPSVTSKSPHERQGSHANARRLDRDHRSRAQIRVAYGQDRPQKSCERLSAQSLDAQTDDGGGRRIRQRERRMEIRVQRYDDPPFPPRKQEQLVIGGSRHSDVAGVDDIEAKAT